MAKKKEQSSEYELLSPVNFGLKTNDSGIALPEDDQPDPHGLLEEGEVVSLPASQGEALVAAGSAKPKGQDAPVGLNHDNPEEYGYQGEAEREQENQSGSGEQSKE